METERVKGAPVLRECLVMSWHMLRMSALDVEDIILNLEFIQEILILSLIHI